MSQYRDGIVNLIENDATVVGVGTAWLTEGILPGDIFMRRASGVAYYVGGVTDDTHLELSSVYAGDDESGVEYSITRDMSPNWEIPYPEHGDVDTQAIFKEAVLRIDHLLGPTLLIGAIPFANSTGAISSDPDNFSYDDATNRLRLGGPLELSSGALSSAIIRQWNRADSSFEFRGSANVTHLQIYAPSTNYAAFLAAARFLFGATTDDGSHKVQIFGNAIATNNLNGSAQIGVVNANAGNAAQAVFVASNGSRTAQFGIRGTAQAAYGALAAGDLYVHSPGDITIMADDVSKVIKFAAGGNTEAGRFTSTYLQVGNAAGSRYHNDRITFPASGNFYVVDQTSTIGVVLVSGATAWAAQSDGRTKRIIEPIRDAVAKVDKVRSVIGRYKKDDPHTRRSFFIAQDVRAVLPEAVDAGDDGLLNLRYSEVLPLHNAAIQELAARLRAAEKLIEKHELKRGRAWR